MAGGAGGCGFAVVSARNDFALTPGMCFWLSPGIFFVYARAKDPQISRPGIHLIKMTSLCKLSWRLGRSVHMRAYGGGDLFRTWLGCVQF